MSVKLKDIISFSSYTYTALAFLNPWDENLAILLWYVYIEIYIIPKHSLESAGMKKSEENWGLIGINK